MEGQRCAVLVLHDSGLEIDDVAIAVEDLFGALPARGLTVIDLEIVGAATLGSIFRREGTTTAEACDETRPAAHDPIIEVEVVAAFFQHETTGIFLVATPVAHEEGAVIGRNVLGGLDGGDRTQPALGLRLAQIDIKGGVTQHQADHDPVGSILTDQLGQSHGVFHRGHDRLFGKNLHAAFETDADVVEMQVIGRADHEQVELAFVDQRFERIILLAC